jgi:hypothetical protein
LKDLRGIRRLCEAQLRALTIPDPFQICEFCAIVADRRGRPLRLLPMPLPASEDCPYGVWVETDTTDYILHEQATSPLHRDQIVLHEISHMLLGHHADTTLDAVSVSQALPDLDPDMIGRVLQRHAYSTEEEQQAELLASLILERTTRPSGRSSTPSDLVGRLREVLQHPVRRRRG